MKVAFARGAAGIDAIAVREEPAPTPGPGEALIRLTAATLNFRDLIMVKGLLEGLAKEPEFVPLSCAAGVVEAVGEGVTRVKPGDRVNPLFSQGWIDGPPDPKRMLGGLSDGVARQYAVFEAESLLLLPDSIGDLDAATLPCAGLTAWSALFGARPLQAGEWIVAQGTGGVSIAALQLAKAAGGNVIVTSSSDAKLARAKTLGADIAVNYRTHPDWAAEARRQRGGQGAAIVIDNAGEPELQRSADVLDEGGIIAAIGMLGGAFSWTRKEVDGKRIVPIGVGNRHAHEALIAFVAEHAIRPAIDAVYDLDRIGDAYRHLECKNFFGKIGVNLL